VSRFADKRILVIGDLMLDEFLLGKVSRISPEAPVPVVEVIKEEWFPGGAANVARNLAEFSRETQLMGVTGSCRHAAHLKELLTEEGINVDSVASHGCYQTIVKTRIIAPTQHVVRIDREKRQRLLPSADRGAGPVGASCGTRCRRHRT
jgi:D-beta-D-heptose 7-phosphate kinase/D-beta-D-heptose 1-phosphate adenosyltransferase